jgi:hypothetical protein
LIVAGVVLLMAAAACGRGPQPAAEPSPSAPATATLTSEEAGFVYEYKGTGTSSDQRRPIEVDGSISSRIPYDAIRPIYNPRFTEPQTGFRALGDDELVIGVSLNGESRAYPVAILRFREMVNDVVGGIPILATW